MEQERVETTEEAAEIIDSRPSPAETKPSEETLEKEETKTTVRIAKTGGDPDAVVA